MYRKYFKRMFDIIFSFVFVIVLFIPMLIIGLLIKITSVREQVIFKQKRIGKDNHPFTIFKFRTMNTNAPHSVATSQLERSDSYITGIGRILRKSSLDELPQIYNVLIGQMSIIGPRPLVPNEKQVLTLRNKNGASQILPGITGLAQISGRDKVSGVNKARLDGYYANHLSIWLDVKIIMLTIINVLTEKGIREGKDHNCVN